MTKQLKELLEKLKPPTEDQRKQYYAEFVRWNNLLSEKRVH